MDIQKLINEYTQLGFTSIIEKGFALSELDEIRSQLKALVFNDLNGAKELVINNPEYNYPAEYANDYFKYWLNTIQGYYERKKFLTDLENYIKEKTVNNTIDVLFEKLKTDFERTPPIDINYKISILEQEIEKNLPKYKNAIDNRFTQTPTYSLNSEYGFVAKIKFLNYLKQLQGNAPKPEPKKIDTDSIRYTAKHYVLAYIFECIVKGESYPIGNKKELESIGNERIGTRKGNRFYKVFNDIISKDLNVEQNLIDFGGEDWRKSVIKLTKEPELVEKYLQNKHL